jgi:hypothetical protein
LSGILDTGKTDVSKAGPVSETLVFPVSRIPDDEQSPQTR